MSIYKDTVGFNLYLETGIDLSGATNIELHIKKPDGSREEWSGATIYGTSQLNYVTQTGNLDQSGWYIAYPKLTLGDFTGYGNPDRFEVLDVLDFERIHKL